MIFNPEKFNPEPLPEENEKPEIKKQDVENLEEDFSKKSLSEKVVSEFSTRKTELPGIEQERGVTFRFERGQIFKAYKILREQIKETEEKGEDITEKKGLLKEIREKAKLMEKDLDELNRQYYENVKNVEIKTEFGDFTIPVVELDLKKDIDPEKDTRVPYFFTGSIATNHHQSAAFSLALALDGHKVYIPIQPEQPYVKKPADFGEKLKNQGDLKIHSELAKQTIEKIGLKEVNLIGYSMGAATALELATDPDFAEKINDLTIIEPLGIEEKGFPQLVKEFGFNQAILKTVPSSEARIKTFFQGAKEGQGDFGLFLTTSKILSKKHFDQEKLKSLNPKGRFQVWVGNKSPVTNEKIAENLFLETEELRKAQNPDASPLEFYKVQGGDHGFPLMNALGFSRMMNEKKPKDQITTVKTSDMENSAMKRILKDIKNKKEKN